MKSIDNVLESDISPEKYLEKKREALKSEFECARKKLIVQSADRTFYDRTLALAEQYMQDLFVLPGTGGKPFFVGSPPRWNERPVPDEEYVYSLNRLYELTPLCQAYILTGDERYAEKAVADMRDWIKSCPRPSIDQDDRSLVSTFQGLSPWRLLECGIRMFETWNDLYKYLLFSNAMTAEAHAEFVISVFEHAEVIALVSPLAWPDAAHNHYIHEMLGLLIVALRFPELKNADEWRDKAVNELFRSIRAQIMPDGAQLEGCANYHDICLDMLSQALDEFAKSGIELPEDIVVLITKAYEYSAWTVSPTGNIASIGDSYMQPLFIPKLVRGYYKRESDLGTYRNIIPLLERSCFAGIPNSVIEEAVALAENEYGGIRHYESVGQIIGRTGWTHADTYFHMICKTPVVNGHSHQDPMSFTLVMGGEDVVIDPSYLTYSDNADRKKYKSIKYHSSLTFGDREPFEYISSWRYGEQKLGRTCGAYADGEMLAGEAYHENYAPCEHGRLCILLGKELFLVCDDVYDPIGAGVKLRFHLSTREYALTEFGASNGKVNIYLPTGKSDIELAVKSPFTDIEEPSSVLSAEPDTEAERALFVTAFTTRSVAPQIETKREVDGIHLRVTIGDKQEHIIWNPREKCFLLKNN